MKKLAFALMVLAGITSCDNDDDVVDNPPFDGETTEFTLEEMGESGVSGTIIFNENEDGSTTVEFELDGTEQGNMYPATLRSGNAVDDGELAIEFEPVDGTTGTSTSEITTLENGTTITYEELVDFDGSIHVHLSEDEMETIVAQTDIGEYSLTGESITYPLAAIDPEEEVSGEAVFEERENGETLVTITLDSPEEEGEFPAYIYAGALVDASTQTAFTLNPVDGITRTSRTNISHFDGSEEEEGDAVTYDDLLEFDGYIYVDQKVQGNIGANASEEE